ncbi:hypothetical protein KF840_23280 [bacterium]|nr:hypothetical protein [bacterium]
MKAAVLGLCLFISAATALAQSDAKIKAIRGANQAEEKAHNLASGIHKRELAGDGGAPGEGAKEGRPKPTPDDK